MRQTLISACVLLVASMVTAEDWPQFRGPTGQGLSEVSDVPVTWSETENIAWKVAIPGSGWSSPVIANDRVYLTTAVPTDAGHELRVLCLDAGSGETLWDIKAFDQPEGKRSKSTPRTVMPARPP
ncbi:MAG: PQQ-binding-like beta-propeller repeat protein [Planctomycetaceae bacterium]